MGIKAGRGSVVTPTWELWPCDDCAEAGTATAGVRNLGRRGYCSKHLLDLYSTFGPEAWIDGGIGLPTGPARPEYGPLEYGLTCICCKATWTGIPGDPCPWCETHIGQQRMWQIDLLLEPPDIDPQDINYADRMKGWAARMQVGIDAGLVTRAEADAAWKRVLKRTVA
jgi:hypothetical protein